MKIKLFGYEFIIERVIKQKRTKVKGFTSKTWSDEDIAKLLRMQAEGKTPVGIARTLGRTTQAITSKLWHLKDK